MNIPETRLFNLLLSGLQDPEGDALLIRAVSQPAQGRVQISEDGAQVIYTPMRGFTGQDAFICTIQDQKGALTLQNVQVTVTWVGEDYFILMPFLFL